MASLFIIKGADQGKRFELKAKIVGLGRDNSNPIRLHDTEVSRRHAEVRRVEDTFQLVDLKSANGTYLNDEPVGEVPLKTGDRVRLGQTVLIFQDSITEAGKELTTRVDMLSRASPDDRSAILRSIPVGEGSRILESPGSVNDWLKDRLLNLSVMYKATQAITHVVDIDTLLPQILQLVFESIGADRGAILLKNPDGELEPKAVRWRGSAADDERMAISRTIIDHVLGKGEGVITSDAPADARFGPAKSIVNLGILEAICVPVQGRHTTLGVLYAWARPGPEPRSVIPIRLDQGWAQEPVQQGPPDADGRHRPRQAGLAIENTAAPTRPSSRPSGSPPSARRSPPSRTTSGTSSRASAAAVTLIDMGLNPTRTTPSSVEGWGIVEKNQAKIYNLVMDMLSVLEGP